MPARPPCPACPTLLLPSVQGEHVHRVGDQQQQAEWRPHLGSLVPAGARGSPGGPTAGRRRGGRSGRQGPAVRLGAAAGRVRAAASGALPWQGGAGRGGALTRAGPARGWAGVAGAPWVRARPPAWLLPAHCPTHGHTPAARPPQGHARTHAGTRAPTPGYPRQHPAHKNHFSLGLFYCPACLVPPLISLSPHFCHHELCPPGSPRPLPSLPPSSPLLLPGGGGGGRVGRRRGAVSHCLALLFSLCSFSV